MVATARQRPKQARSAATIEHILDTAERLAHERGADAVTIYDICQKSNLSPGRLYYWFPDFAAVLAAVEERAQRLIVEFLPSTVLNVRGQPTSELLRDIMYSMGDLVQAHPGVLSVLARHRPPGADEPVSPLVTLFVDLSGAILDERVAGTSESERDMVATSCVSISIAMLRMYLREPDPTDRRVLDELVYVLCAYLFSRYPDPHDAVWDSSSYALQPARVARATTVPMTPVYPARWD